MPSYAAFIGHQPHISLAELSATVPGFTIREIVQKTAVVFDASEALPEGWLQKLGGTVVFAEQLEGKNSLGEIPALLLEQVKHVKGKTTFSLRTAGLSPRQTSELYRTCKEHLKNNGKPSRYVGNERKPALSVVLRSQGLLDAKHGCELTIIKMEKSLWVGVTRDAQDINAYTKRDMEKPVRDMTVGILPPKLAQVMLNFGVWLANGDAPRPLPPAPDAKKNAKILTRPFTVLDPFCGTGVIPMECMLRGYETLASDKAEKAVSGTQKNLEWVRKHWKILKTDVPADVWKQDALKEFDLTKEKIQMPDVIVTETSLGPNLKTRPTAKQAQMLKSDNEKLQEDFLKNAAKSFPGIPLVVTWPAWYYSKGGLLLDRIWKTVEKLGYEAVLPPHITPIMGRPSLLYRRPDQFVAREIVLLRPKKK